MDEEEKARHENGRRIARAFYDSLKQALEIPAETGPTFDVGKGRPNYINAELRAKAVRDYSQTYGGS